MGDLGEYGAVSVERNGAARISRAIGWAIGVIVITGSIARLFFGVDLTDESFYSAVTYRFILGDRPYVSDLQIAQNAGLLTYPLAAAWVKVTGGADGLVLFMRFVYLAMRLGLAALAANVLIGRGPRILVVSATLLPCAFVFFVLPAPGYNTVGSSFAVAALLSLWMWGERGRRRYATGAFAFAAVACFAHPALLPLTVAVWIAVVWRAKTAELRKHAWLIAAAIAVLLAVVAFALLASIGPSGVTRFVRESTSYVSGASIPGVASMPARLMVLSHFGPLLLALWIALWFASRMPVAARAFVLTAYVGLTWLADNQAIMVWLALSVLPLGWQLWRAEGELDAVIAGALSLAAGLFVGMGSSNGVSNVAAGSELAAIVAFLAAYRLFAREPASSWAHLRALVPVGLMALTTVRFAVGQWRDVYRDDRIRRLTAVVPSGPYRGLHTTPEKLAWIEEAQAALREHSVAAKSFAVFNRFPGAHLMVPVPPATPTVWIGANGVNRGSIADAIANARRPTLVMQVFRLPETATTVERWTYPESDTLVRTLKRLNARTVFSGSDFSLHEILTLPVVTP